jgi:hypothetical protein
VSIAAGLAASIASMHTEQRGSGLTQAGQVRMREPDLACSPFDAPGPLPLFLRAPCVKFSPQNCIAHKGTRKERGEARIHGTQRTQTSQRTALGALYRRCQTVTYLTCCESLR